MHQTEETNTSNVEQPNCKKKFTAPFYKFITHKKKFHSFRYEMREEAKMKMGIKTAANPCLNDLCDEQNYASHNVTNVYRIINLAVIVVNTGVDQKKVEEMVRNKN